MFRTIKTIYIFLLTFLGVGFLMFLFDELIYDYSHFKLLEMITSSLLLGFIFYGVFVNFQTLKVSSSNPKNMSVLEDVKFPSSPKEIKKAKISFRKSLILNLLIFILSLVSCIGLLFILTEEGVVVTNFNLITILFLYMIGILLLSITSLIIDVRVREKLKQNSI